MSWTRMTPLVGLLLTATVFGQPPSSPGPSGKAPGKTEPVAVPTLRLGDAAPPLQVGKWVKGDPIKAYEPGKVYIVFFWTTWCIPCHEAFPLLNELRTRYPDVPIIAVSFTDAKGESIEKVIPFVQEMDKHMNFNVAFDDDRKTILSYMDASGFKEIPTAYIVNQNSRVAWMGHPLDHMDDALAQVVAGKYDLQAAIIAARIKAEKLERAKPYEAKLQEAYQKGDMRTAFDLTDQLVAMEPQYFGKYAAIKFSVLLTKAKAYDEAYKYTQTLMAGPFKDNALALNRMAWTIMDEPGIEKRDYDIALRLARRANEIQKAKDPDVMDTLARAYFQKGDFDKAIEWQNRAMELAKPESKKAMLETIEKYKAAKAQKAAPPGKG